MNLKLRIPISAVLAALLAGCASTGNNFDDSKVSQIKKGETTEAQLIQMFGEPQRRGVNSEGATTLMWMYMESSVKGESFIPYAGPFVGGSRHKQKTLERHLAGRQSPELFLLRRRHGDAGHDSGRAEVQR